jgi:ATP-dependent Lhr-like helicase
MIEIHTHTPPDVMRDIFNKMLTANIDIDDLLSEAKNLERAKWDWALPKPLLNRSFASLHLNFDEAKQWVGSNIESIKF